MTQGSQTRSSLARSEVLISLQVGSVSKLTFGTVMLRNNKLSSYDGVPMSEPELLVAVATPARKEERGNTNVTSTNGFLKTMITSSPSLTTTESGVEEPAW